ncbi:hypothetical protein K491DRAFT_718870 [Lophiostoma macrostomum CBS 122681]|uniref:PD-(D/E)XK nuclease-like domain-containing protein n=1 Tax=Lophiostoma macrostomum CBS 122681 TaxID=1314788 RepID=A0A6A6SXQ9_9PLEO|nr:hypothetical protein K491DRAFT_718870 [Lophiostoma macrostomum CBS 122681]
MSYNTEKIVDLKKTIGEGIPEGNAPYTPAEPRAGHLSLPKEIALKNTVDTSSDRSMNWNVSQKSDINTVKSYSDLKLLSKPVQYVTYAGHFPVELKSHWKVVRQIQRGIDVWPDFVSSLLRCTFTQLWGKIGNVPFLGPVSERHERRGLTAEFGKVLHIWHAPHACSQKDDTESKWNSDVHKRWFACALEPFRASFKLVDVQVNKNDESRGSFGMLTIHSTSTRLVKNFSPQSRNDLTNPKVVDFILTMVPSAAVEEAIRQLLITVEDPDRRTIIQNMTDDARWNPAFTRIHCARTHMEAVSYLAPVGDTRPIESYYHIIKLLRYICDSWARHIFMPWFIKNDLDMELETG